MHLEVQAQYLHLFPYSGSSFLSLRELLHFDDLLHRRHWLIIPVILLISPNLFCH